MTAATLAHPTSPAATLRLKQHLPNALTIARLVLAAAFVALLSTIRVDPLPPRPNALDRIALLADPATAALWAAAILFLLAALTDSLDGVLARKWNAISRFGRVMDPMADKVLVLGAFIMLAGPAFTAVHPADASRYQLSAVSPWMVVVILARELLVTSLRGVYEAAGVDFSAGTAGKLKMIAQSAAVPLILLIVAFAAPTPGTPARAVLLVLSYATVAITLWSAVPYITRAVAARRTPSRPTAAQAVLAEALPPATLAQADPPDRPAPTPVAAVEPVRIPTTRTRSQAAARSRSQSEPPAETRPAPSPPPTAAPSPAPRRPATGSNSRRKPRT